MVSTCIKSNCAAQNASSNSLTSAPSFGIVCLLATTLPPQDVSYNYCVYMPITFQTTACMPRNNTISLCVQVDRSKVVDSLTADDLHVIMQAEDEVHAYGYTACVRTHYNYTVYCNTLYCPDACCGTYSSYTCLYSLQYSVHTPRPILPFLQLSRCGEFERVFPCSNYNKYKKFFEVEVTNK